MDKARRLFINRLAVLTGAVALKKPFKSAVSVTRHLDGLAGTDRKLAVYYTNDLHGNINAVYKGLGGLNHIKTILDSEKPRGLVFDAGGFMTGSKNPAAQKKLIALMNAAGYHAAGLSSRELAMGQDNLAALVPLMQFSLINCNHQFDGQLAKLVKPFIIMHQGAVKVGVTAVCRPLKGVYYMDAIKCANRTAQMLKEEKKCDLVICLSHLGNKQHDTKPDNLELTAQSQHIDMIIGGNNHKLLDNALVLSNKMQNEVILTAAGWDGLMMGRTMLSFDRMNRKTGVCCEHFIPGKPANTRFAACMTSLLRQKDQLISV